jgi:hypothetical protein
MSGSVRRAAFEWKLQEDLHLPLGAQIRVLRRDVVDSATLATDLLPFRENRATWLVRAREGGKTLVQVDGRLRRCSSNADADLYLLKGVNPPWLTTNLTVSGVRSRELTVWRVQDELDMLQVHVVGEASDLYAQVGGDRTLPTLGRAGRASPGDASFLTAIALFRDGGAR